MTITPDLLAAVVAYLLMGWAFAWCCWCIQADGDPRRLPAGERTMRWSTVAIAAVWPLLLLGLGCALLAHEIADAVRADR